VNLEDEFEREKMERRQAIFANSEARRIVDAVFANAGMPIEAYGELYLAVLEQVDSASLTERLQSRF
jgi:hypothetical protein